MVAKRLSVVLLMAFVGCSEDAPTVNVTVPPGNGPAVANAYDVDEGSSLDLVIAPEATGATITSSTLPTHATLSGGVFSFTPDYTQAGIYSVTFTIAEGTGSAATTTTTTIAVRVHNLIHITPPPSVVNVNEGSAAGDVTFSSTDLPGTVVQYTADVASFPGATFDPVSAKLSFKPSWRWRDSRPAAIAITVTAEGTEIDSGKTTTSTAKVLYQINEATSFKDELVPMFLLPIGATSGTHPEWESVEGHNCMSAGCHDGTGTSPAGLDYHPNSIYNELVNKAVSLDSINGSTCHSLAASGVKQVVPNDPSKSLWYMKISGTDGNGGDGPPCGVQQSVNQPFNWLTVTDTDAWLACPPASNCRSALNCSQTDIACKLDARYVRKARLWILAGAPNN